MLFVRPMQRVVRVGILLAALALTQAAAQAKPEYAAKEKVTCLYCHEVAGQARNFRGIYYGTHDHSFADFDNVFESKAAGVKPDSEGIAGRPTNADYPNVKVAPALKFIVKDIDGKTVNLGRYQGSVILLVNVASLCGNTPQYASLQKLYDKYKTKGLVVLGFPSNDFGKQEPGDNKEIKLFCTSKYKVTFPMFSKIDVKGDDQAPLYKFLTDKETDPKFAGDIEWNFAKFIINRKGEVVARIPAKTDPATGDVVATIEKQLKASATAETASN